MDGQYQKSYLQMDLAKLSQFNKDFIENCNVDSDERYILKSMV